MAKAKENIELKSEQIRSAFDNASTLSEADFASLIQAGGGVQMDMTYHAAKDLLGGVTELQAIESSSVQRYGKTGVIKAGRDNNLYQHIAELKSKCGLLSRIQAFLISTFYTELGFKVGGEDVSQKDDDGDYSDAHRALKERLENVGVTDSFREEFGIDVFLNGFASPEIAYSNQGGDKTPNHVKITKSRKVRLCKLRPMTSRQGSAMYPQEVLVSSNNWKDVRKTMVFPIVGSTKHGFGYRWREMGADNKWVFSVENYIKKKKEDGKIKVGYTNSVDFNEAYNQNGELGLVGYYLAIIPDSILEFVPYPYWGASTTYDILWSYAQMAAIKAGYMKRSLFKAHIIVLNRKRLDDPKKEQALKVAERQKIENESGAANAGGAILMWEHSTKDDPTYLTIYEMPQISNHQFLKYLDDGYDRQGAFELGVDPELLNLFEKSSGFSNKAQTLLLKYVTMMGDVGKKLRSPFLAFINFLVKQMGMEDVEVYFQKPELLQFLEDQAEKENKTPKNAQEVTDRTTDDLQAKIQTAINDAMTSIGFQIESELSKQFANHFSSKSKS